MFKMVKIINATKTEGKIEPWYNDKIGEIFKVDVNNILNMMGHNCFNVIKDGYPSGLYIKVEDCEVI